MKWTEEVPPSEKGLWLHADYGPLHARLYGSDGLNGRGWVVGIKGRFPDGSNDQARWLEISHYTAGDVNHAKMLAEILLRSGHIRAVFFEFAHGAFTPGDYDQDGIRF